MVDTNPPNGASIPAIMDARQKAFRAVRADKIAKALDRRQRADRYLHNTVRDAHDAGLSWAEIGTILGTSRQAAQQRFGA